MKIRLKNIPVYGQVLIEFHSPDPQDLQLLQLKGILGIKDCIYEGRVNECEFHTDIINKLNRFNFTHVKISKV